MTPEFELNTMKTANAIIKALFCSGSTMSFQQFGSALKASKEILIDSRKHIDRKYLVQLDEGIVKWIDLGSGLPDLTCNQIFRGERFLIYTSYQKF